ncbi:MAG: WG repeat-containing protein [Clostridiales bacterium]|jgi:hypothetical protein|nr:WG repeat-containing protein [Clostridiales bacterium]
MENITNITFDIQNTGETNTISVEYGKFSEIPFPPGTVPVQFLGANHFLVSNGKFIGKKYGVVNSNGEIIIPVEEKHSQRPDGSAVFEMLDEKVILFEKDGFTLYDLKGTITAHFKKLIKLGSGLLAVSNGDKVAMAKIDGSLVTGEDYDSIRPFADGVCIAQKGDTFTGFLDDTTVAFTISAIDEIRDFFNGYAVIKKGGKFGAIDESGNFVLEAKWKWLRNCGDDAFVFSEAKEPKVNIDKMGLVTFGDKILIPCKYTNLEQIDANLLKYGTIVFYQYDVGNTRYTKSLLAFGLLDYSGNIIAREGITGVGTENEGLRAYSRYYSDNHIEFGYMDKAWNSVLKISDMSYGMPYIFNFQIDDLLSPFFEGKAFIKLSADGKYLKKGRWIDKNGESTSEGKKLNIEKPAAGAAESPDDKKAKLIIDSLRGKYTPLPYNAIKGCHRILGDFWQLIKNSDELLFNISKLESVSGFSCGLLAVKEKSSKKIGFIDHEGQIAMEAKYDEAEHFNNNRTWVRQGKQYFILKREVIINGIAPGNVSE